MSRAPRPSRRITVGVFVGIGLVVALGLAFFVSPFASSSPDGLEKVAADKELDGGQRPHALADGPLADYSVRGIDDDRLSTGLAGIAGVAVTFVLGLGLFVVLRRVRGDHPPSPLPSSSPSPRGGGP